MRVRPFTLVLFGNFEVPERPCFWTKCGGILEVSKNMYFPHQYLAPLPTNIPIPRLGGTSSNASGRIEWVFIGELKI